jgi:superfamily I DNA and/or RNA helicase
VKKFKQKIGDSLPDFGLKCGTVEEFQGEQRSIILVSTVRTEEKHFKRDSKFNLGFLQCEKRMNVAISRAQSLLVVFGKAEILRKDKNWGKLIEYTEENETFVSDDRI